MEGRVSHFVVFCVQLRKECRSTGQSPIDTSIDTSIVPTLYRQSTKSLILLEY